MRAPMSLKRRKDATVLFMEVQFHLHRRKYMQPHLPSDSKAMSLTIDTIIFRYHELVSPLVAAYLAGYHKDLNWSRYHALVVIEKQLHHIKSKKDTA